MVDNQNRGLEMSVSNDATDISETEERSVHTLCRDPRVVAPFSILEACSEVTVGVDLDTAYDGVIASGASIDLQAAQGVAIELRGLNGSHRS